MARTQKTPGAISRAKRLAQAAEPPKAPVEANEEKKPEAVEPPKRGRPRDPNVNRTASKNKGLQPGLERFTVAVSETVLQDMRGYAYTVRLPLKDVVEQAFVDFLAVHSDVEIIRRPNK